jgi:hypothetical protein
MKIRSVIPARQYLGSGAFGESSKPDIPKPTKVKQISGASMGPIKMPAKIATLKKSYVPSYGSFPKGHVY